MTRKPSATAQPCDENSVDAGTRDRLLASAVQLLSSHGLEGTGLSTLIDASGTTKGSLYHCNQLFEEWAGALAVHLRPDGHPDGKALAEWIVASFEGALLLSRVRRSGAPLREAAGRLREVIDAAGCHP